MKKLILFILILTTQNLNSQNENFEEGSLTFPTPPGTITIASTNAINGWTVNGGSNSSWGSTGNCTNTTAITGNPSACKLISPGASGHIDGIIGSGYPIYSVFGNTTTTYPGAATVNGFQCYGDWFIKLNDQFPGASVQKITKAINVTPSNCLFEFAYMSVVQGSHCCCDGGGFALKLKTFGPGCTGAGTYTSCPQFTLAPPAGAGCVPTGSCNSPGTSNSYFAATASGWNYTKWKKGVIDLTSYIGACVNLEVFAKDCPYSSHAGYVYFDAQSSSMDFIVNGNSYNGAVPMFTVGTCGSGSTATITAPPTTGGYTWTCPGPYTIAPGSGGQTIYTGITGNHTLTMNPEGSCFPIIRVLDVNISPSPNLAIVTSTMYSCTTYSNGVDIQMASGTPIFSNTPNYNVSFSPAQPTTTTSATSNTGSYWGLAIGINTITITDAMGCPKSVTLNVTAAPAVSSFSIDSPFGTTVGCAPPSVSLIAVNTNTTLSNMSYTWTSSFTGPQTGSSINAIAPSGPNTYTVIGYDPVAGSCMSFQTITINQNLSAPNFTITPVLTQSIGCNQPCKSFTAVCSTTSNVFGAWYDVSSVTPVPITGPSSGIIIVCAGKPGTYAVTYTNVITGCTSTQTVAVTSNTSVPTLTISSVLGGFDVTCTKPCLPLNLNTNVVIGPTTYTWTNLTTNVSTYPATGGYTVCATGANVPGKYSATVKDGFGCAVTTTVTIGIDTLRPAPTSTATLPSLSPDSYTINCFTPSIAVTGVSNPMYPAGNYSWTVPPSLIQSNQTVTVSMVNVTATMPSSTNYTVLAMNPNNGCVGRKLVRFYKDIFVPPYSAVFTPSAITCANPCVAFTPNNIVPTNTIPVTYTFTSPPPTQTAATSGALFCVPGPYTMTYMNALNGCTAVATNTVPLNVTPPATLALAPVYIPCGSSTATIFAGHTASASPNYSYTWEGPPLAGMSCPGGVGCYSSTVNSPGVYEVNILNTINGCSATNSVQVIAGSLAPLTSSGNSTICAGETTTLTASGATTYTWSSGPTTSSIAVSPTVNTTYTVTGSTTSGSMTCFSQTTVDVTVNPCVGIREYEKDLGLTVAPNPNTGKFSVTIKLKHEAEIIILNSLGQEVFRQMIKDGRNEINTGNLAKGIYHYNINHNKQQLSRGKIIIE